MPTATSASIRFDGAASRTLGKGGSAGWRSPSRAQRRHSNTKRSAPGRTLSIPTAGVSSTSENDFNHALPERQKGEHRERRVHPPAVGQAQRPEKHDSPFNNISVSPTVKFSASALAV